MGIDRLETRKGKRQMITVMLAVSRARFLGVITRIENHRLVFSKDGRDIGSTLIEGIHDDNALVSENAVNRILDGVS
jgi:hypothetical protein